jgi:sugar-specific transcriptional regulator TrmB
MLKKTPNILGLSKIDKAIMTVLSLEKLTVSALSRKTQVPKTTLNYAVKKLERRGLLVFVKKGERKLWALNDADTIDSEFASIKKSLWKNTKNSIVTIPISENTRIEIHQGTESLYKLWEKFVSLPKTTRLCAIQPDKSFNTAIKSIIEGLSFTDLVLINESILNSKIIVDAMVHERSAETVPKTISSLGHNPIPFLKGFPNRLADTAKLPSDFMDANAEMYIYNDTFIVIHWEDKIAVSITNKDVAKFFKEMFESLKFFNVKYNQNERMSKKIKELESKKSV